MYLYFVGTGECNHQIKCSILLQQHGGSFVAPGRVPPLYVFNQQPVFIQERVNAFFFVCAPILARLILWENDMLEKGTS